MFARISPLMMMFVSVITQVRLLCSLNPHLCGPVGSWVRHREDGDLKSPCGCSSSGHHEHIQVHVKCGEGASFMSFAAVESKSGSLLALSQFSNHQSPERRCLVCRNAHPYSCPAPYQSLASPPSYRIAPVAVRNRSPVLQPG